MSQNMMDASLAKEWQAGLEADGFQLLEVSVPLTQTDESSLLSTLRHAMRAMLAQCMAAALPPPAIAGVMLISPDVALFRPLPAWPVDQIFRECFAGRRLAIQLQPGPANGATRLLLWAKKPISNGDIVYRGYDRANLNRQYSPRATVPDIMEIFDRWRSQGAAFAAVTPHLSRQIVGQAGHWGEYLVFFPPITAKKAAKIPLQIFIHGGYWQAMDKAEHPQHFAALLAAGQAVCLLNYPLYPDAHMDDIIACLDQQLTDLLQAVDAADPTDVGGWSLADIDLDALVISGHSAGAHLAAYFCQKAWGESHGYGKSPFRAAVLYSGVYDLAPLQWCGQNHILKLRESDISRYSLLHHNLADWEAIPYHLLVGGAESDEFIRQTAEFAENLAKAGHATSYDTPAGLHHFSIIEAVNQPGSASYVRLYQAAIG